MKETLGVQTQTFTVGDGFLVDIIVDALNEMYEAWIYHRDYGIKELMYGEFFDTVDLAVEDYKHYYMKSRRYEEEHPAD